MNRLCQPLLLLPLAWAALAAAGCDSGPKRHEVSGEITFKGRPVADGIIEFEPLDGGGTMSGAQIENGKYLIPRTKGLAPGRYKVTIVAGDGSSGAGNAEPAPSPGGRGSGKEMIPPDYNVRSKLVREVKSGETNKFDFPIP
jgi:hypothetical protein